MAQTEFAQILKAGEQALVAGPGVVEFKTLAPGAINAPALGGAKAVGTGVGKGIITTTTAASAKSLPASFLSGKVLGFSLASVNPWALLAIGVAGGYILAKKKYPRLVW
ncbi:MAG: hypothetical protein H7839_19460 [Magnetococcus sp. YQC-5]